MKFWRLFGIMANLLCGLSLAAMSQSWQPLKHQPGFGASVPLLLTDGTVLIQEVESPRWWKLTPDIFGSYVNGTWTKMASMASNYGPLYYASAVLKDGRVVVIGGEYNLSGDGVWTNKGAIYDPVANVWTSLAAPPGWDEIGDAQCVILPNGKFMLAHPFDRDTAILDPSTLTWTVGSSGKADKNDEEGWTLLPNGKVLTINCWSFPGSELYTPSTNSWSSAGTVPGDPAVGIVDAANHEVGPAVVRPNGSVFAIGGINRTALYFPNHALWAAGPSFPTVDGFSNLDAADAPACVMPNGKVLCCVSPGYAKTPTYFFEYDGISLTQVPRTPNSPDNRSFQGNLLVLPSGQALFTDFSGDVEIYTSPGSAASAWKPVITSCPTLVQFGGSYLIKGQKFNGLTQCNYYGDDSSNASNYPLVRITNNATGHVFYCRTYKHSTMAIATGTATVSTNFQVPAGIESGASTLQVVTNGIPSSPFALQVAGPTSPVSLTVSPTSIPSGTTAIGTVTIPSPAPAGGVVIALTKTHPHVTIPATVTIPQGKTGVAFPITADLVSATSSGKIVASNAGVTITSTCTVVPATIASVTFSPSSVVGGIQNSTATVSLNGVAGADTIVTLASANTALATVPSAVVVHTGNTSSLFTVTTLATSAKKTVAISGTTGSVTKSGTLTVKSIPIQNLLVSPTTVKGGSMVTVTVNLTNPAIVPMTVTMHSSKPLIANPTPTITFTEGVRAIQFNVRTSPVVLNTSVVISAVKDGITFSTTLKVTP